MPAATDDGVTLVRRVWIEAGCIQCGWCSDLIPEVFQVSRIEPCVIRGEARSDGSSTPNREERAPLLRPIVDAEANILDFVAAGCPSLVIKFSDQ